MVLLFSHTLAEVCKGYSLVTCQLKFEGSIVATSNSSMDPFAIVFVVTYLHFLLYIFIFPLFFFSPFLLSLIRGNHISLPFTLELYSSRPFSLVFTYSLIFHFTPSHSSSKYPMLMHFDFLYLVYIFFFRRLKEGRN